MALDNYCLFPPLDWDLHTLVGAQEGLHETFPMSMESPVSSEASSGYLQDAVAGWSSRCKRQRMAASPPPRQPAAVNEDRQHLFQNFWELSGGEDLSNEWNTMIPESSFVSGEEALESEQLRGPKAAAAEGQVAAAQGREEAGPPASSPTRSRSGGAVLQTTTHAPHANAMPLGSNTKYSEQRHDSSRASSTSFSPSSLTGKEKRGIGVLYPFAVVKPLGLDGVTTTLSDVNQRILKRPARPVRHPVGPFACNPSVSPHGLGLSGKAVVSLTRIRTGGKGTITIIRTRG